MTRHTYRRCPRKWLLRHPRKNQFNDKLGFFNDGAVHESLEYGIPCPTCGGTGRIECRKPTRAKKRKVRE